MSKAMPSDQKIIIIINLYSYSNIYDVNYQYNTSLEFCKTSDIKPSGPAQWVDSLVIANDRVVSLVITFAYTVTLPLITQSLTLPLINYRNI